MQCACAILSPADCPDVQYFPTLSHKRQDFRKKVFESQIRFFLFSLQLLSAGFVNLRETERDKIKKVKLSSCKGLLLLSDFNET